MSGSIVDGSAETIQALDHGAGFAVLGNSRGSVVAGQAVGAGVIGVFGAPFAQPFPKHVGVAGVNEEGPVGFLAGRDPLFNQHAGVFGESDQRGVFGNSPGGFGVAGLSARGVGVHGVNGKGATTKPKVGSGLLGESEFGNGLSGISEHAVGVFGRGPVAGHFEGNVEVTGKINGADCQFNTITAIVDVVLSGADCAEEFDITGAERIDPGTVMVINEEGALQQSQQAYDKRVAGVISGAGGLRPGIILDRQQSQGNRMPIALVGKVYCKVDAQYARVEVGDMLTTSPTPGHAMKAGDPFQAFGSVIGKALRRLESGQGLVPILIALQ
jgi:hypothetical protein